MAVRLPRLAAQSAQLRDDRPAVPRRAAGRRHARPKVEDVRDALDAASRGLSDTTARQYVLRIKSLLGYAHKLGYTQFNAAATIKVRSDAKSRCAKLAKRIITPAQVSLLIRAARTRRDRVLLQVGYAGGLRVSELVGLAWSDVLEREEGRVQLSVTGKGGVVRQVVAAGHRQPIAAGSARRRRRQ
jgi:site-specific recombinase XerD